MSKMDDPFYQVTTTTSSSRRSKGIRASDMMGVTALPQWPDIYNRTGGQSHHHHHHGRSDKRSMAILTLHSHAAARRMPTLVFEGMPAALAPAWAKAKGAYENQPVRHWQKQQKGL
jgi:hypothetical protein